MNEMRVHYLQETLKLLTEPEDIEMREAIKRELAVELDVVEKASNTCFLCNKPDVTTELCNECLLGEGRK